MLFYRRYLCKVIVVVLRNKIDKIYDPHRALEARVKRGLLDQRIIE
ncbi:hypothetical protein ACPOL_4272 [Acidisarcina polymorpha]|uniref:Uncharacterized protein n=1 Tax=Acidisarcina polymorpha TaxID=2211140 RepID=A0A2Z5G493_9BACT|nr:hypothetical protein ACPOL_4272 [Acidisarcina polymorpha]